jgi:hypothetical protein
MSRAEKRSGRNPVDTQTGSLQGTRTQQSFTEYLNTDARYQDVVSQMFTNGGQPSYTDEEDEKRAHPDVYGVTQEPHRFDFDVVDSCIAALDDIFGVKISRRGFVATVTLLAIVSYTNSHLLPFVQDRVYMASDYVVGASALFCVYLFQVRRQLRNHTLLAVVIGAAAGNVKPLRSNILFASIAAVVSILKS